MGRWKSLLGRLRALWDSDAVHGEIDEEMRFHIDMRTEENVRRGMTPEEARQDAERRFGRLTRIKEMGYEVRGGGLMESFWNDLRYGARALRRNPRFTCVAIVTLALGIGANTAVFSVVNGVLLKPLPFDEPERLMIVQEARTGDGYGISYPNFLDVRTRINSFERVAVFNITYKTITGDGVTPERVACGIANADLFPLLGASPVLGRSFTTEEDRRGGETLTPIVVSYGFWQRRFGVDPQALGKQLILDGKTFTIVGVMPRDFSFPVQNEPIELWTTVAVDADPALYGGTIPTSRGYPHYAGAIARLKPGVTLNQAQAELDVLAAGVRQDNAMRDSRWNLRIAPALDRLVGDVRPALLVLFGVVGIVLAVACANVANLLLARATSRHKEIAVRTALGASRWRVVRQLLTESILLGILGGIAGLLIAMWGVSLLTSLIPEDVPRLAEIGVDWRVACFTLFASTLAGLLFGVFPALSATKINFTSALKEGARGGVGNRSKSRQRGALVVIEVMLAVVLLVGAGMFLRSFVNLLRVEPGFDASQLLTFRISLPESAYPQGSARVGSFYQRLLEEMRAIPGVSSASIAQFLPLSGSSNSTNVEIEGRPALSGESTSADLRFIGLDYFRTMSIPLSSGRDFDLHDTLKASGKIIVNEAFVRRFLPEADPLGKRITTGFGGTGGPKEIVGVVSDVKHANLGEEPKPEMYIPFAQFPVNSMTVVVRANDLSSLPARVTSKVRELDKDLAVYDLRTLDEYVSRSIAQPRFNAFLIGTFALLALVLAVIGIYGVVTYSVAERTHEIGIRMALGAGRWDVLTLVIKQGMTLVVTGVIFGVCASYALARLIRSLLYGTDVGDPLIYSGVILLLMAVALLACFIPAYRATRVDPLIALRNE